MNNFSNKNEQIFGESNQMAIDISTPFSLRLNLNQVEELQKNTVDFVQLSSPSIGQSQSWKGNNLPKSSIFRFLKVLQKKIHSIRQNRKKFSFFKKVYQEKIFHSEYENKHRSSKYMMDPKNFFLLSFQYIECITMMILLIILTYCWSFANLNIIRDQNIVIYVTLVLILNISLQFNQAIIEKGQIIYDRIAISRKYFSKSFFKDAIFIISMLLLTYTEHFLFALIFYVSGITRLFKIFRKLQDLFDMNQMNMEILKLVKLLIFINLLAHFIACIWYFIGKNSDSGKKNWLDYRGIREENQQTLYISSFYFSVVTMITVGYGDITPQNNEEMLICIFVMYLSCGVYAYSLNLIGQVLLTINLKQDKLENNIRTINKYFKQHNIKDELQSRIKNYLHYKFMEDDHQIDNIYTILNQLSKQLRNKIVAEIYSEFIQKCPLLIENFSKTSLIKSSHLIETISFERDDFIINQRFPNENALYFIDSGIVEIYESRSKTTIIELQSGQYFGEFEFFTNSQAKFSYKCKSHTKVFKLQRQSFIDILGKDDFEMFHFIKHCYDFNIPIKQHECLACNKIGHAIHNCKILFYHPDFIQFNLRQANIKQKRQKIKRRNDKQNSLSQLQLIQEKQFEYCEKYSQEFVYCLNDDQLEISPDSEISALYYQNKKPEAQESQLFREKSIQKLNTIIKTKQSLSDYTQDVKDQNYQLNQKSLIQSFRHGEMQNNQNILEFDAMKEFSKYFVDLNYEYQIHRYNQNYFNRSFVYQTRRKTIRAMRCIKI